MINEYFLFKVIEKEAVPRRCSTERMFLKIFAKLAGKHLHQSRFFNQVTG